MGCKKVQSFFNSHLRKAAQFAIIPLAKKGSDIMLDIISRAGCFIAIIILGYVLRRTGFFNEHAFPILCKIVLKITLPASIVVSFSQMELDASMLTLTLLGFGGGLIYALVGFFMNIRKSKAEQAFDVLNLPGYNIGIFTLPFLQSFLGPAGVVTASLFDTGNAVVCLGGTYGVASSIKAGKGFSLKRIGKALITSVPFMSYLVMIILNLLQVRLPGVVLSFAGIIKDANAFIAMLMIGVGFKLEAKKEQIGFVVKRVVLRYGIAAVVACIFYFLLPFSAEVRQALVIVAFSPISSSVPAFTEELGEDSGISAAINSICIVVSIVIMVTLLMVM